MNIVESEHAVAEVCKNCGQPLAGPFCAQCGQAEHDGHPPTLGHFFHDLVHEFVHVDGKIFRTLKALFFEPGKLTQEYWAGHIVPWLRPIRLFLVIAAMHLLLTTGVSPVNFRIRALHLPNQPVTFSLYQTSDSSEHSAKPPSEGDRLAIEDFKKAYDSLRYGVFFLFGAASWLLYRRKQPYFANHIIAGLHFYSFWYCLSLLLSLPAKLMPVLNLLSCAAFVYLFLVQRRLFPEHWLVRLMKTFLLVVVLLAAELGVFALSAFWVIHHPELH